MKEDARRREALDWLRLHPGWFLVIDNLDTPEALTAAEALLAHLSKGHVVVTTRLGNFSAHFAPLELDVLSVEASVEFLEARTEGRRRKAATDEVDARAIATDLGRLALALEHAGAYVAQRRRSFGDYRKDWARERDAVLGWHSDAVTGYPRSVAAALRLSLNELKPEGRAILEHLAFLAPEPAPESLLEAPIPGFEGDAFAALEAIDGYSLVKRDGEKAAFAMHRLVQDVVRRGLTTDQADARCVATLLWLIAAIDGARHTEPGARRRAVIALEPHADAAAGHATSESALEAGRYLLVEIGDAFVEAGFLERARRLQAEALAVATRLAERDPGDLARHSNIALSRNRIGDVLVSQGNLREALASYRAGLSIAGSLSRSDPGNAGWRRALSVSYIKLGDVLVSQGNLPEALASFRAGLSIAESLSQSDPGNAEWRRDLSVTYDRVGDVLVSQGNLPEALASFRAGLSIRESLSRSDPGNAGWRRDLSVSHNKLGDVLVSQGNLPEALASYRAGLSIRESLSRSDPGNAEWRRDLSVSYNKLGDVLVSQGNLPEALASYRAGLAIAESLSQSDPDNAGWRRDLSVSYDRIGGVLVSQGNLPEALASYRAGLTIAESLSQSDPDNAGWRRDLSVSYDRVGDVLVSQGNLPEALASYRAGSSIRESLSRSDPGNAVWRRDLSVSYNNLGDVWVSQGNLPEALASYRAGLSIRESLSQSDPGNAGWRRDLIISCVKIAQVFPGEARAMLTRAGAIANRLRDEGRLAPVDARMLGDLAQRIETLAENPVSE